MATKGEDDMERASLLDRASRFLDDDAVSGATEEQKRDFLNSKGLSPEDVTRLLNAKFANEQTQLKAREDDSATTTGLSQSKDSPPIITYPDFLIYNQRPTPLVTARGLLSLAYGIAGAAVLVYGTGKYLVEPMQESLIYARHSQYESAIENLDDLRDRLSQNVSKLPTTCQDVIEEASSDVEELSSDGGRFYTRTAATQTSPTLSRSASISSSLGRDSSHVNQVSAETEQLEQVRRMMESVDGDGSEAEDSLEDEIKDLSTYFHSILETNNITPSSLGSSNQAGDSFAKLKAEIRGVKGVLLSARNFPAAVTGY